MSYDGNGFFSMLPCLHLHPGVGVDHPLDRPQSLFDFYLKKISQLSWIGYHPLHLLEQSFFTVDAWYSNVERNANWQISLEIQRNPCDSVFRTHTSYLSIILHKPNFRLSKLFSQFTPKSLHKLFPLIFGNPV